jgi:hypothetical protein
MAPKAGIFALMVALANAPFQCAHEPRPDQRTEDDPAEAIYLLAEQFRVKGDAKARAEALDYLTKRYPNSRYAVRAREDLGQSIDAPPSGPAGAPSGVGCADAAPTGGKPRGPLGP